jgi:hypothetical protein
MRSEFLTVIGGLIEDWQGKRSQGENPNEDERQCVFDGDHDDMNNARQSNDAKHQVEHINGPLITMQTNWIMREHDANGSEYDCNQNGTVVEIPVEPVKRSNLHHCDKLLFRAKNSIFAAGADQPSVGRFLRNRDALFFASLAQGCGSSTPPGNKFCNHVANDNIFLLFDRLIFILIGLFMKLK